MIELYVHNPIVTLMSFGLFPISSPYLIFRHERHVNWRREWGVCRSVEDRYILCLWFCTSWSPQNAYKLLAMDGEGIGRRCLLYLATELSFRLAIRAQVATHIFCWVVRFNFYSPKWAERCLSAFKADSYWRYLAFLLVWGNKIIGVLVHGCAYSHSHHG